MMHLGFVRKRYLQLKTCIDNMKVIIYLTPDLIFGGLKLYNACLKALFMSNNENKRI